MLAVSQRTGPLGKAERTGPLTKSERTGSPSGPVRMPNSSGPVHSPKPSRPFRSPNPSGPPPTFRHHVHFLYSSVGNNSGWHDSLGVMIVQGGLLIIRGACGGGGWVGGRGVTVLPRGGGVRQMKCNCRESMRITEFSLKSIQSMELLKNSEKLSKFMTINEFQRKSMIKYQS